ncbi:hypothetical protein PF003_g28058 [Phytophthora fragariae]|nr:hypothetical protein PF003_g28058 [Phytophthora fragariae]
MAWGSWRWRTAWGWTRRGRRRAKDGVLRVAAYGGMTACGEGRWLARHGERQRVVGGSDGRRRTVCGSGRQQFDAAMEEEGRQQRAAEGGGGNGGQRAVVGAAWATEGCVQRPRTADNL